MSQSDWLTVIGVALGLAATFFAGWWFAKRARQRPDIRAALETTTLIDADEGLVEGGLRMTFREHEIKKVSRTAIAIWNARGDVVRGTDVVETDRLRIQLAPGDMPLQPRILYRSREQIKLVLTPFPRTPPSVVLDFDFLDSDDGAVVELIHQGGPIEIAGTVRGARVKVMRDVALAASALQLASEQGRLRRLRSAIANATWSDRLAAVTSLLGATAFVVLGVVALPDLFHSPRLVDPSKFNLHTIDGQADFTSAVTTKGRQDWLPQVSVPIIMIAAVWMMLNLGYRRILGRRTGVPRSVLREKVAAMSAVAADQAATDGELAASSNDGSTP